MSYLATLLRRPLWLAAFAAVALAIMVPVWMSGSSTPARSAWATGPVACANAVDVAMLFDHSGSMGSPANKLTDAKAAAIGFVDAFAGSPSDTDLTPHHMAAVSFSTGASTDQVLTTNATAMRNAINAYTANGYTNLGWGLWLAEQQLEPATDPDVDPDTNDYMVLLSDGSANQPMDVDNTGPENDVHLDVNGNGRVDTGDDLSVDFPGGDAVADFIVIDGLWVVGNSTAADTGA